MLDRLGLAASDIDRLPDVPVEAIVAASTDVFYEVPVRSPGTLAFAPIVDGDVVPDYPVKLAREGHSHPVPLIIGTNKHEAALFKWMKSPLMPITPERSTRCSPRSPPSSRHCNCPPKTRSAPPTRACAVRPAAWVSRATSASGCRRCGWPKASTVAPVYLYRFDFATPMLRLLRIAAAHATELPFVWGNLVTGPKDPTFKLGGLKTGGLVSERVRARWLNFATHAKPVGLPGEPEWLPYQEPDRASLLIGRQDTVVNDIDADIRATWGTQVLNFR